MRLENYTVPRTITIEYEDHDAHLDSNGHLVRETIKRRKDITVNVNIEAEPFEESVNESVASVETLTGAIAGFQAANIAAKRANEKNIVQHVTTGFLNMIEQNINVQSAGMAADMTALAGELKQQCDELGRKHDVMARDFNRIKSRYTALFDNINREFSNRMHALMRPLFDFTKQVKGEQERRAGSTLLSMATTGGAENDAARTALQVSKMKGNAQQLIGASRRFIDDNRSWDRTVTAFCTSGNCADATYYVPVVIAIQHADDGGAAAGDMQVYANPVTDVGGHVTDMARQRCAGMPEAAMSAEVHRRISDRFQQQLSQMNDGTPQAQRLIGLMRQLFETNAMKTF